MYRDNLNALEAAKSDLTLARGLLTQAKSFPTVAVFRLLIAIVLFLGVLAASFYMIWYRQVSASALENTTKEQVLSPEPERRGVNENSRDENKNSNT